MDSKRYVSEIRQAYALCERDQGRSVDFVKLNLCLARLMQSAVTGGLTPPAFEEIVRQALPHAPELKLPKRRAA